MPAGDASTRRWFRWRKASRPRLASKYNRWHLSHQLDPLLAVCGTGAPTLTVDPALEGASVEFLPPGLPLWQAQFTCPKCWRRSQEAERQ